MEDKIDTAEKKVLVDIVKLVQKRGMKGTLGDWKEFLNIHDKKYGANLSDPAKRPHEILAAFLKTFSKDDDLKFFDNIMRRHSNQDLLEQLKDKSHDSLEQRLVQKTLQHPLYSRDYTFAELDEGWVVINLRKKNKFLRSTEMVAVDCEMVLCEDGTEAVVQVCVVDRNLEVKLNKLVHPNKAVADYRTEITGISSQDLEGITCSLADIQKFMKKLLSNGAILVGHSLHNDLHVLKLDYVRVIDTSYIFQCLDGPIHRRPSLNSLCKAVLGNEVREIGVPHNCLDDATAAMKLVLAKIKQGVDNVDNAIPLVQEHVLESKMAKLLLHRISTGVKIEELRKVVPGDFTLELKPSKGEKYSVLAIFKNPQEAHDAYENVQGSPEKDSFGHPQKLVTFQLRTGMTTSLYVRKMAPDGPHDPIPSKRALQMEETIPCKRALQGEETFVSKKAKMDAKREENAMTSSNMCDTHLNEINALNYRLKQNDVEIESLINALNYRLKQNDVEIESLRQQLKQNDMEIESLRQQLKQNDVEIESLRQQLKPNDVEIESLRQQLKQKDYDISVLNKMVSSLQKKRSR